MKSRTRHAENESERDPMKFSNGDVSLDDAINYFRSNPKKFTPPNSDLLEMAVIGGAW